MAVNGLSRMTLLKAGALPRTDRSYLMLLGSPPDMVRSRQPRETCFEQQHPRMRATLNALLIVVISTLIIITDFDMLFKSFSEYSQ